MSITLNLGPVKLAWKLDASDPRWQEFLHGYRDYLDDSPGQLLVETSLGDDPPGQPPPLLPNSFIRARSIRGGDFVLGEGLISGSFLDDSRCRCTIHPALVTGTGLRVLEQFLYLLYYHVVLDSASGARPAAFLLHSSAVLHAERVFVFCGPAGSGKSTAAALSAPRTILTDECTICQPMESGLLATGSPINPFCQERCPGHGPVAGIFLLRQAPQHSVAPLRRDEAVPRLAAEVIAPLGLLDTAAGQGLARALDCALALYETGLVRELQFKPDGGFWSVIEEATG